MRGKDARRILHTQSLRITPAGAGKSRCSSRIPARYWDHPRRCGEKDKHHPGLVPVFGSPPQVRGKGWRESGWILPYRITPAGAGKRHTLADKCLSRKDHPRRCGEKVWKDLRRAAEAGSPPQVRGKDFLASGIDGACRITPAGAGKRKVPGRDGATRRDHPRRCGEK